MTPKLIKLTKINPKLISKLLLQTQPTHTTTYNTQHKPKHWNG